MELINDKLLKDKLNKKKSPFTFSANFDPDAVTIQIVATVRVNDNILRFTESIDAYSNKDLEYIVLSIFYEIKQVFLKELFDVS